MPIILGIESTAHTFGIGIVRDGKILSNVKRTYTTESGGIIPIEAAKFHFNNKNEIYFEALSSANVKEEEIDAIAFSQGPGLSLCLLEGMKFAKELSEKLGTLPSRSERKGTRKPLVPVNHCVAHLEIGRIVGANDSEAGSPVMLYCSGANTQIIAYEAGKYRIFGETLDIGVGNFIDTFARYAGIGFPGGPVIQKLAESKNCKYIELPYSVKGMDVAFSGILTKLRQMLGSLQSRSQIDKMLLIENSNVDSVDNKLCDNNSKQKIQAKQNLKQTKLINNKQINYTLEDLAFSLQETAFAMLVETAERALAHTGKKELLLGGGVACNKRLQEMCRIMCRERGAKLFVPENSLLVDNAGMIAFLGEIMFKSGIKCNADEADIKPRQRTDDVMVSWK